jgi:cytochrome P450
MAGGGSAALATYGKPTKLRWSLVFKVISAIAVNWRLSAASAAALPALLFLICTGWKKLVRYAPLLALMKTHKEAVERICRCTCPSPTWLCAPWFALRSFYKALLEHRHLHMLHELHELIDGTFAIPLPFQATYVLVDSPQNVEHVLKTNFENYVKGKDFFISRMTDLLGNGIFNADGSVWHHQRKTSSQMFTQKKLTNHIWSTIERNCDKVVDVLLRTPSRCTVDMFNIMNRFTLDTIGEIGFARNIGSLDNADSPFLKAFDKAQQICFLRMVLPFWGLRRLLRLGGESDGKHQFALLHEYSLETVRDLKANLHSTKGDSFVGLFMQESERSGVGYDEKFMQDMVLNFLIAGRDTTAQSLSWTLYLVLGHPEVEKKALEEIGDVCGGRALKYEDVQRLTYLQAVVNESLRLYPSVPMDIKKSLGRDTLPDGTSIEKDDVIVYNIFSMGRSKKLWGDDADDFKPDRWLGSDFPSLYTYPVFNAGPRECLGRRLAWIEMKACLARILPAVKFTLAVPRDAVHYDMQLTLGMSSGLPCHVEAR